MSIPDRPGSQDNPAVRSLRLMRSPAGLIHSAMIRALTCRSPRYRAVQDIVEPVAGVELDAQLARAHAPRVDRVVVDPARAGRRADGGVQAGAAVGLGDARELG